MIVDGEKYACDACIRGHRVSSCTHKDRKLTHVNKKGRPLTQCPHCRGLRKSRASHVKCDCGEIGHSRNSSVESTGEGGCKCQTGKRCVCAHRKEPLDLGEIQKAHGASSRRVGSKPGLPVHNSDSAVPTIRAPVPPLHRFHSHHHEHGHPYPIARPRPMTEALHMSQHSRDFSERGCHSTIPSQSAEQGSVPVDDTQFSNPANARYTSPPPRRRPGFPTLRLDNYTSLPLPDFSASVDVNTVNKAISPGNPARYSFHDLSQYTLGAFSRQAPEQDPFAFHDEMRNANNGNWQTMNLRANVEGQGNKPNPNPITPSDISVEYSLSSQLGVSSSGTMSEAGDITAQPSDFGRKGLPFRPVAQAVTGSIPSKRDETGYPPTNLHNWVQYLPGYAASDPSGVFDTQSQLADMNFNLDDLQGADAGPGPYVEQNSYQHEVNMPMMTEEGVRDWVGNPAQMQDPNFNFDIPGHYNGFPAMEGSYGWI